VFEKTWELMINPPDGRRGANRCRLRPPKGAVVPLVRHLVREDLRGRIRKIVLDLIRAPRNPETRNVSVRYALAGEYSVYRN